MEMIKATQILIIGSVCVSAYGSWKAREMLQCPF
jgi:hypothetical protein